MTEAAASSAACQCLKKGRSKKMSRCQGDNGRMVETVANELILFKGSSLSPRQLRPCRNVGSVLPNLIFQQRIKI